MTKGKTQVKPQEPMNLATENLEVKPQEPKFLEKKIEVVKSLERKAQAPKNLSTSKTMESKEYEESKHTKKLREEYIHFTDDFMFSRVMSDTDLCKEFLETILGKEIEGIVKHETQKYLAPEYDARSMRLDVYTETAITMVNTEMQKNNESQIGKRSRYSGSLMDKEQLSRGSEYKDLKARYVIFIYSRDPFKKDLPQYTFRSICVEDKDVELDNGIVDIVINLKGNLNGTREDLKELIGYMAETINPENCKSSLIHKIHAEVERANRDPELRRMFVTVGERYLEIEREAREKGMEIAEMCGIQRLIKRLCSMGMALDVAVKIAAEDFDKSINEVEEMIGGMEV